MVMREVVKVCLNAMEEELGWIQEMVDLKDGLSQQQKTAGEESSARLDSSMKKNTALIRKLKSLNDENSRAIMADIGKVNQSKYVSEAVSAILDAPLKSKDVKAAIRVCCMLHTRYPDFSIIMKERLLDMVASDGVSVAKQKTGIKIFFCLVRVGVVENVFQDLMHIVRSWTRVKMDMGLKESHSALVMLNTFLKSGGVGLMEPIHIFNGEKEVEDDSVEEGMVCLEEIRRMSKELWCLKKEHSDKLKERVYGCYEIALSALNSAWSSLEKLRNDNNAILNTRGDLSEKRVDDFQHACEQFDSFKKVLGSLAYTLCRELPEYEFEENIGHGEENFRVVDQANAEEAGYFDDPDDVAFYQTLPPLSELVPPILLGQKPEDKRTIEPMDDDGEEEEEEASPFSSDGDSDNDDTTLGSDSAISLSVLIAKLPECVSIELCDRFVVEFCNAGGSRATSQKALCKALQRPPFGAMHILPFYSRIVASLSPWFPLIKDTMVKFLQREFYGLKKKIDIATDTLEPRLRNACYTAELIKFGIYPPGKAFTQLRSLFDDFSRHNVDTACCLVEHCGRYLYQRPDTMVRMKNMMGIMVKIKNAKNLEQRHVALIDAAQATVYGTFSPQRRKARSREEEYIRHLIYSALAPDNVAQVSATCRKFIWSENSDYIHKKIMSAARKGKHTQISPLVSLTDSLALYYPSFSVGIVDEVMEEIFCGLENPDARYNQRRLSMVRFLGELCNQRCAGLNLTSDTMYLILNHSTDGDIADPHFRIKLVATLAIAGAPSLTRSRGTRSQLYGFLPYFEEFVMFYHPLPMDVELDIEEMYKILKVKRPKHATHKDAQDALLKFQAKRSRKQSCVSLHGIEESDRSNLEDEYNPSQSEIASLADEEASSDIDDDAIRRFTGPSQEEESFERELALALGSHQDVNTSAHTMAGPTAAGRDDTESEKLSFKVMTKRGGKKERSQLVQIPVTRGVAQRLKENKEAEAAEKAALKRMVLASEF